MLGISEALGRLYDERPTRWSKHYCRETSTFRKIT
jgi:hypothetical protein